MGGMGGVMRGRGRGRGRGAYHPYGRGGHATTATGGGGEKEEALTAPVAARTLIVSGERGRGDTQLIHSLAG